MTVIEEIKEERARQLTVKGYHSIHDDEHKRGEIATFAKAHIEAAHLRLMTPKMKDGQLYAHINAFHSPQLWKVAPHSRRDHLIIAAALLVAEIERLDRMEKKI